MSGIFYSASASSCHQKQKLLLTCNFELRSVCPWRVWYDFGRVDGKTSCFVQNLPFNNILSCQYPSLPSVYTNWISTLVVLGFWTLLPDSDPHAIPVGLNSIWELRQTYSSFPLILNSNPASIWLTTLQVYSPIVTLLLDAPLHKIEHHLNQEPGSYRGNLSKILQKFRVLELERFLRAVWCIGFLHSTKP